MASANTKTGFGEQKNVGQPSMTGQQNKPMDAGLDKESIKQTANETLTQVKAKTSSLLSEQKENLTTGLSSVADTIRQVSEGLRQNDEPNKIGQLTSQYGGDLARQLDKFSRYVENAEFQDLARDLKSYARRQPALFIGGAFTLGLLAARFLKTSHPTQFIKEAYRETTGNDNKRKGGDLTTQTA